MPVGFPDDQAGFVALPFLGRITFAKIHTVIDLAVLVGTASTVSHGQHGHGRNEARAVSAVTWSRWSM